MATTSIDIAAPPNAVYATLMDAWTYEVWVRGTKRVRDVDPSWPAPGSRFHHSVGAGPLVIRDQTVMVTAEPERLVELDVHIWPVGKGRVRLELTDNGDGTTVVMHENFTNGPAAVADNPLQQLALKLRNDWGLDKLQEIVEQRHRMNLRRPPDRGGAV